MLYIYLPVLYYHRNLYVIEGAYPSGRGFPLSQRSFLFTVTSIQAPLCYNVSRSKKMTYYVNNITTCGNVLFSLRTQTFRIIPENGHQLVKVSSGVFVFISFYGSLVQRHCPPNFIEPVNMQYCDMCLFFLCNANAMQSHVRAVMWRSI